MHGNSNVHFLFDDGSRGKISVGKGYSALIREDHLLIHGEDTSNRLLFRFAISDPKTVVITRHWTDVAFHNQVFTNPYPGRLEFEMYTIVNPLNHRFCGLFPDFRWDIDHIELYVFTEVDHG